jgi:hypothetical protein
MPIVQWAMVAATRSKQVQRSARDPIAGRGFSRHPRIDQGAIHYCSRDARLELGQGSLTGLSGGETEAEELCGQHHEYVSEVSHVEAQVLKQKDSPLLIEAVAHCAEINEDCMALKVGDVKEEWVWLAVPIPPQQHHH